MSQPVESSAPKRPQPDIPPMVGPGRFGGGFGGGFGRGRGPVEKPKSFWGTLKRLWKYLGKEKQWLIFVFALVLVSSSLSLLGPYLIGYAVDAMSIPNRPVDFAWLQIAVLALAAAYTGDAMETILQG